MPIALDQLPDDVEALKALVADQLSRNEQLTTENQRYKAQVLTLTEQLNLALARRYAASSEKLSPDQIRLFDEAEVEAEAAESDEDAVVAVPAHTRRKRGRKPLPDTLPRIEVVHELPEPDRFCPRDGARLAEIGEVSSEQLDIVPAKIRVIRHIRKQYACTCGQCIKTAPLPPQPIPKSLASPGLLAHITVSKYQDALPLYRQATILNRIGVDLPRATLANWMIQAGALVQPVINLLRDRLLAYDIVQMDETPVQVLKAPGKTARSKSYLWVQRGGPPEQRVVLYDYDPSRSQTVPKRLLEGFTGYLQTDGYDGYNAVVAAHGLTHVGCMAHARRKFHEAVQAQGKGKHKNRKGGHAHRGLALIQKLYRVEKQARTLEPKDRHAHRQRHAKPLLETLRTWLDEVLPQVPPATATGKALNYLNNEWPKLVRYLEDGRLEIDNNGAENAIRPFVVGRKNWLFSTSVKGVKASANLYSLIETAKANGLEPYAYLRRVFSELPRANTIEAIEALLPGA
ncbi:IS66 family transposase [Thiohalobacter sp. IOR34]|uniref:IS66 family transposase n=1 Tax=Thiohalobacter sp. IOR34 TaxID=3057176 RepID=UPI0025B07278|nr:IS66 family transposase [Thiohalobacter sp. IOR34]WJW74360.1 IS66 family transposase [Thiohalobacter sp. IOR34]WJW75561.1 IS66 family transposase [Thiohalobacter sp. IOR34]WJW76083.1 IS66 family transposase [Thiohalobacter sp. IOR34]